MDIKRNIRLFFVSYGKLLFEILFVIVLAILVLQWLNNKAVEQKQSNTAIVNIEDQNNTEKNNINESKIDKKNIEIFIEYCKNKRLQDAYSMVSDNCKKARYNSIDLFNENYVQKYFNVDIEEYRIYTSKENYIVVLKESAISTGKQDLTKELKFSIENEILDSKIYVYD